MLIRYKKTYEKIAMGLLSYMPDERNVKALQETIHVYETDENWHLFLWKKGEDLLGLLGIEVDEDGCIVHHLSVNPSYRNEGIGKAMVAKVQELYPEKELQCSEETASFIHKYKAEAE